jgi:hypothetical protein
MSGIIENSRPEAEISGVTRMIESIAYAKCPITLASICIHPESCPGCHETINQELNP